MNISTTELLNRLKKSDDLAKFIEDNKNEFSELSCTELLNEMLVDKKTSLAKVAKASGQGDYVYKVFQGKRKPSRDIVIAISIGMELSIDETQFLLRISKLAALDPRDKRDSAILYGLKEQLDINRINDLLFELNEATL